MAEAVLYAETRMGELIQGLPDFHSSGKGTMKRKELPEGINKKQSHYARQLADNQDVVEQ